MQSLLEFLIVFAVGFAAGWFERDIRERVRTVTRLAIALATKKPVVEQDPGGTVIEPTDDPVAAAKLEFEQRTRRLNGD